MKRQTVLALSLAAALALPIAHSTSVLAITDEQRSELATAAAIGGATMEATISNILIANAANEPLGEVLDDLSSELFALGATDDLDAEMAVMLIAATQDAANMGALPGVSAEAAGTLAAESVLVAAESSPSLTQAIVTRASGQAAEEDVGGQGAAVLASIAAASSSPRLGSAAQTNVQNALVASAPDTVVASGQSESQGGTSGAGGGGGSGIGNMNLASAGPGDGGGTSSSGVVSPDRTGAEGTVSPN